MEKSLLGSNTFWFNAVSFTVFVLALPQFVAVVPVSWLPYVGLVAAIGNGWLRTITSVPITSILPKE